MQHARTVGVTKPAKARADALVVAQGLADSRSRAQALIRLGAVIEVDTGRVVDKAGEGLAESCALRLRHQPLPYVGRGALKLRAALDAFAIDPSERRCLDVGASTGGFTDLLLQRGAAHVVALDVGHNQLDYRLRRDPRVQVLERCHVIHAPDEVVSERVTLVTVDVSFISLSRVLPALPRWLVPGAWCVWLVKPQFEVGPARVDKGGIVRCPVARADALEQVMAAARANGFSLVGHCASPVDGAKGNQETLLVGRFAGPSAETGEA